MSGQQKKDAVPVSEILSKTTQGGFISLSLALGSKLGLIHALREASEPLTDVELITKTKTKLR